MNEIENIILNVFAVDSIAEPEPYAPNNTLSTDEAINADQFLEQHQRQIQGNPARMFSDTLKTNVHWYGTGTFEIFNANHETFLWQWLSDASMTFGQESKELPFGSCIIVPKNVSLSLTNNTPDCVTLSVAMPLPE